jgi:hypothetical protein
MEKAKLTYEQAQELENRIKAAGKAEVARSYLNGHYSGSGYNVINTIETDDFFKAITNGWEIKIPEAPILRKDKLIAKLNTSPTDTLKGYSHPIFISLPCRWKDKVETAITLEDAKDLKNSLSNIIDWIENYSRIFKMDN